MPDQPAEFADLLREERTFAPPADFRARAHVQDEQIYERAARDPEAFWASFAEELEWSRPWTPCSTGSRPHAQMVRRRHSSTSRVNCVDRHVRGPRRNKAAIIWEGEPGDRRTLTYFDLYREVSAFANVLKSLGVSEGRPRGDLPAARFPSWPSRCSPAPASARCTASCSAASAPNRCAIASTTRRPGCSSRPTAATGAARSCRSSRSPTRP